MKSRANRRFFHLRSLILIVAMLVTSFATGTYIGRGQSHAYIGRGESHAYIIDGTIVPSNLQQPLSDLWQSYQHLMSDSYWRPFDGKQLLYAATSGMMSDCCVGNDTHTTYSPPAVNQPQVQELKGSLYGIGAEVGMSPSGLLISALMVDSPAERAGIQAKDVITKVNGHSVLGMSTNAAVQLIEGPQDTTVVLNVVRPNRPQPLILHVVRGSFPSVVFSSLGNIGYIQFSIFGSDTAAGVHAALQQMVSKHMTALILDLRNNGGGYVDTARTLASEFLPRGAVIFWERTNLGNGRYSDVPQVVTNPGIGEHLRIVVLVNGGSYGTASAAEILTAALREDRRATVIGTTTYGKGSEQELLNQPDGSALRITTQLWLTPRKRQINGVGIIPDIIIDRSSAADDNQLQRARQYIMTGH